MDIKLTHSIISEYLDTPAPVAEIARLLSLCGPTVDRLHQLKNDWIYDIEVITNRVDTASALGIAREAASILPLHQHKASLKKDPYSLSIADLGSLPSEKPLSLQILDSSLAPRLAMISLSGVRVKPSSPGVQTLLSSLGLRPLNNVVDVSNELMLHLGLPVHIFDLNKIAAGKLILRGAKKGEKLTTLDGVTHTLNSGDIVFEDGDRRLVDLCGIMGGQNTAVDDLTTDILLLVPVYDPKKVRSASLRLQNRSLASQIFEKRPDPDLVIPALVEGVRLLTDRTGASVSSSVLEVNSLTPQPVNINLDLKWLYGFIGQEIPLADIENILSSLGFKTTVNDSILTADVPSWRLHDCRIKEDLAEEIARVYGYFRLPSVLPPTTLSRLDTAEIISLEYDAKVFLAGLGLTEIYNYSLVSADLLTKTGFNPQDAIPLANPLSEDYHYLRTSLAPSLLYDLYQNRGKVDPPLSIFELANVYIKTSDILPRETSTLALAETAAGYLHLKGRLEALFARYHLPVTFIPLNQDIPFLSPGQSASVCLGDKHLGYIGMVRPAVAAAFDLKDKVVIAEINFKLLTLHADTTMRYTLPDPQSPIFEDITISSDKRVGELLAILNSISPAITTVEYRQSLENRHTFRLAIRGSLSREKIDSLKDSILRLF